jgi:predicted transcriptional regulator
MTDQQSRIELAAELTMAWLGNPNTRAGSEDVLNFLQTTFQAVEGLSAPAPAPVAEEKLQEYTPAVTARKSLANPEHIISLIDGKPYKTLRRHLATNGLTPDEYRERYGLKADYPMVAPAYSDSRRAMAKQIGLGRKPAKANASEVTYAPKPKHGGRKSAAEAKDAAQQHLGTDQG